VAEAHVGPLREMGGRAELKGRRWAAREWARGGKKELGQEERLGRPKRGKGRESWFGPGCWVDLGRVLDLISISISFLFLIQTKFEFK